MADVRVDVSLDTSEAEKDAEGLKGKLKATFSDMGKIAGGIFMAQIGTALADKGVETLKSSITLARDFNEIQSKSNTIFGESASAINAWAASASTGFGQSKAQALDAASSFGNMFSQLGIGAPIAADMSKKMTELASDFASFHNADITSVLEAQQAAFRGEYDALQKFVPTISAATVQQEAMAETGKTNAASLTAQEKATATYTLMLKGAGQAQGDFDRTSGSLANQQRILSAQWADFQVQLGQVLIPALTAVVTTINTKVIPAVRDFAEDVKTYWESDIKPAIANLQAAWEKLSPVIIPILEGIANHIENLAKILGTTVSLILALISGDWSHAWDLAKQLVSDFLQLFKDDMNAIKDAILGAIPLAAAAAQDLGKGIFNAVWEGLGDLWQLGADIVHWILQGLKDMAWQLWDWAESMAKGLADKLNPKNIIGSVTGGLGDLAGGVFDQSAGGASALASPGGMGAPSSGYVDPRGVTLTANDILDRRHGGVTIIQNIGSVGNSAEASQLMGDAAWTLAAQGV